ncbi:hypothetical protein KW787_03280 [Candidatus Pacearchaeota archaeon]|nr:hypothetical protein [Candidatus Pacearchaeota archaeon]
MSRDHKLFLNHYEPGLTRNNLVNVVLRIYSHIKGLETDDPENSTELIFTPRSEVDQKLDKISELFREDRGIAITSLVGRSAELKHLFLLDCKLEASVENDSKVVEAFRCSKGFTALSDGMILKTQNSYHIAGFVPLEFNKWIDHMGSALLLRTADGIPIADHRYIGHSLKRGYGSLRISDYQGKPLPIFLAHT